MLPPPGEETLFTLVVQDKEGTVQKVVIMLETTSIHLRMSQVLNVLEG